MEKNLNIWNFTVYYTPETKHNIVYQPYFNKKEKKGVEKE